MEPRKSKPNTMAIPMTCCENSLSHLKKKIQKFPAPPAHTRLTHASPTRQARSSLRSSIQQPSSLRSVPKSISPHLIRIQALVQPLRASSRPSQRAKSSPASSNPKQTSRTSTSNHPRSKPACQAPALRIRVQGPRLHHPTRESSPIRPAHI